MRDYTRIPPGIRPNLGKVPTITPRPTTDQGFGDILKKKLHPEGLKISAHAKMRMDRRNIRLNQEDFKALERAVEKAEEKGVKSSLVLMEENAFVVSVKNKTVITAIDGASIKENVFTNIDGAVII